MHTIDKQKFIDAFLREDYYKHLNTLLSVILPGIVMDISPYVNEWLNKTENIQWLAFIENMAHPERWSETSEAAYQQFLLDVQNGKQITIDDWQQQTQGLSILCANEQYFCNTFVAIIICKSLDEEVWQFLQPAITKMAEQYPQATQHIRQSCTNFEKSELLAFICPLSFDSRKSILEAMYGEQIAFQRQVAYINQCMIYAQKYLIK